MKWSFIFITFSIIEAFIGIPCFYNELQPFDLFYQRDSLFIFIGFVIGFLAVPIAYNIGFWFVNNSDFLSGKKFGMSIIICGVFISLSLTSFLISCLLFHLESLKNGFEFFFSAGKYLIKNTIILSAVLIFINGIEFANDVRLKNRKKSQIEIVN